LERLARAAVKVSCVTSSPAQVAQVVRRVRLATRALAAVPPREATERRAQRLARLVLAAVVVLAVDARRLMGMALRRLTAARAVHWEWPVQLVLRVAWLPMVAAVPVVAVAVAAASLLEREQLAGRAVLVARDLMEC
jgi:hypothetical protein